MRHYSRSASPDQIQHTRTDIRSKQISRRPMRIAAEYENDQ